jgi:hypothetical protein
MRHCEERSDEATAWARRMIALAGPLIILLAGAASSSTNPQKWDGSRISPVHQIPLKDELNQLIVPTESNPLPFSARFTCAPCHDYGVIKQGLHFNGASDATSATTGLSETTGSTAMAGRPGEPWIWLDERTGTQIPVSTHPWKGVWNPARLGLSDWDFTLLFARHMPGGGAAEPPDKDMTPESRWSVSGKIEINCLGCHNASRRQNPSEWAKQVLRQNFRWAATAAAGLGEVGGMSSRLRPTWDIFDGPNPDDSEWAVAPSVKYDRTLFDSKHRAFLDIAYKPDDARCLACHSASPIAQRKLDAEDDVHSAAGIKCASCHRHDVSHAMVRGYEGEAGDNPALLSEDFTCKACHLGGVSSRGGKIAAGRLGAPYPLHKGIPAVHFDRLACTVCHSGPMTAKEATRVRTSRANRLGIFGVANWTTALPAIQEPVYLRDKNNKLTPNRMMWPAFWGEVKDGKITPLAPEKVLAAAGDILFPEKAATRVLAALFGVPDLDGTPVLIMAGTAFELNVDGGLTASPYEGEKTGDEPAWAVRKDGKCSPLLAAFDPTNAETSADPEARIQKILEALNAAEGAPGKAALLYKGFFYKLVDNALDKSEKKEPPTVRDSRADRVVRDDRVDRVATPHFGWLKDGTLSPFIPEPERKAIAALAGSDQTLTEDQVADVLKALGRADHVYISGGVLFRLNDKGALVAETNSAADPVAWPLAHQVRPARQALGVNGCTDCHSATSNFFFGRVRGAGPLRTEMVTTRSAASAMGLIKPYQFLFGLSFTARPAFKLFLGAAAALVGALLLIAGLVALGRFAGLIEKRN